MEYKLTEHQLEMLARGITVKMLEAFYADPKNQAAFEAWQKEKNKND